MSETETPKWHNPRPGFLELEDAEGLVSISMDECECGKCPPFVLKAAGRIAAKAYQVDALMGMGQSFGRDLKKLGVI